jgi:hypothetical protein
VCSFLKCLFDISRDIGRFAPSSVKYFFWTFIHFSLRRKMDERPISPSGVTYSNHYSLLTCHRRFSVFSTLSGIGLGLKTMYKNAMMIAVMKMTANILEASSASLLVALV